MAEEMFKTTLMGGFDKDDVLDQVARIKAEAWEEQVQLKKEIAAREEKILQLTKRLELKDEQYARLEADVRDKYQKYVDNYDSIGRLVFEAQIQADEMVKQAQEECSRMLEEAEAEAKKRMDLVQAEVDEKLAEGKKRYVAVQEEMNEIVELINQAQNRFMASYKEVHRIVSAMPASLRDIEEEEGREVGMDPALVDRMEFLLGIDEESE